MRDTNPDHYKVGNADFIKFMDDPQIKGFGDWMFANGFNTGEFFANKWISVKDRLPEKSGDYIAYTKDGIVWPYFFCGDIWEDALGFSTETVTHWMPLPEPPREN